MAARSNDQRDGRRHRFRRDASITTSARTRFEARRRTAPATMRSCWTPQRRRTSVFIFANGHKGDLDRGCHCSPPATVAQEGLCSRLCINGAGGDGRSASEITGGAGDDVLSGGALADDVRPHARRQRHCRMAVTAPILVQHGRRVHRGRFTIDGGADSTDTVNLSGDYTGANAVVFGAATMTNVEFLEVVAGGSRLQPHDRRRHGCVRRHAQCRPLRR